MTRVNPTASQPASQPTAAKRAPKPASWAYAEDFVPEHEAAPAARQAADQLGATPVTRGAASTLTFLARAIDAKAVVEIGSGAGVSGLALFAGMRSDGILTSIDSGRQPQLEARKAFLAAGIPTQRFRLIAGAALNVLPKLSDGAYDLVLIDGDKLEYVEYVAQALRLLRHGGLMIIDNALWHDKVADPANDEDETVIIREALEAVTNTEELVSALIPVGDGLLCAVKE